MQTTGLKQAAHMYGYRRDVRVFTPIVPARQALPPRWVFEQDAELLAAYDHMQVLNTAIVDAERKAGQAEVDAEQAKTDYAKAISDAINTGKDASKIRSREEEYRVAAEHWRGVAAQALTDARPQGVILGRLLHEKAPSLYTPVDKALEDAAAEILAAVQSLEAAWSKVIEPRAIRSALSNAAMVGGAMCGRYNPTAHAQMPDEVKAAVAALREDAEFLDRLRSDEANITAWREKEAAAAAWQQSEIGRRTS